MKFKERSTDCRAALWGRPYRALIACVTISAVIFTSSTAFALDTIRVGKAGVEAFAFLPVDIGAKLGIFKKQGLDVDITTQAGGAKVQESLAGDAIDIGLGAGPDMVSIVKGSPVKAVAVIMGPPDLLVAVVRADGDAKSWDDLKGRGIAISQANSLTGWLVRETSRQKGWGPNGIQLVSVGDQRSRVAALKTKQVDAMVVDLATALAFQEHGQGKVLDPFGHFVKKFIGNVIFASNDVISQHPDRVRRFLVGWFQTIKWMTDHRAETIQLSKGMMNVDDVIAGQVYDLLMPDLSRDGRFEPDALKVLAGSFVDLGTVMTPPDMKALYTERFLPTPNVE